MFAGAVNVALLSGLVRLTDGGALPLLVILVTAGGKDNSLAGVEVASAA